MTERRHVPETGYETVTANGLRFAFLSEGSGPLVLLLHGFPDTARSWDRTRGVLAAAGYRAVSPWLRGYTPTALPDRDTTSRTMGEDVLALIDALGDGGPALVVGHDWGAEHVYAAANLGPDKLRAMVTIAIPYPAGVTPTPRLAWALRHFGALKLPGAARRFARDDFSGVDVLVRRWSPTWDYTPADVEAVKNALAAPGCLDAALGYYRAAWVPELTAPIGVPTLAFAGRDDANVGLYAWEQARRRFTGEYRVEAIGGGHFCHLESPDAFEALLVPFLDAHR